MMATADQMFEHLNDIFYSLMDCEQKWVSVLQDYYRRENYLSEKQLLALRDIYFRHSDEFEEATAELNEQLSEIYQQLLDPENTMPPEERKLCASLVGIVEPEEEHYDNEPPSLVEIPLTDSIAVNTLAQLLIEKGLIKREEFYAKLTQVRGRC